MLCALLLSACEKRPVNEHLEAAARGGGYRGTPMVRDNNRTDTVFILAFSGGGTRAAAFAYGVLEELARTPLTVDGMPRRMLDEVDIITGVSGGSFTALSYALYGDRLFEEYEPRFLKRDVQGALIRRTLNPFNWPKLWSSEAGRSELAAAYYDEILFNGATFGDLINKPTPRVVVTGTEIATGIRFPFTQSTFDMICSNLSGVPLSRAAAASSAVPLILSPVTLNNYGGTCGYREPEWLRLLAAAAAKAEDDAVVGPGPGRAIQRIRDSRTLQDSTARPYLHLVDGGVSDNLGVRGIIEGLEALEQNAAFREARRIGKLRRVVVIVVNAKSAPDTDWNESASPPGDLAMLIKSARVPIDRYSFESVELLRDVVRRWSIRGHSDARLPDIQFYPILISFDALGDDRQRHDLQNLPTSFVLPAEAVDRLRAAAAQLMRQSALYGKLVRDLGGSVPK